MLSVQLKVFQATYATIVKLGGEDPTVVTRLNVDCICITFAQFCIYMALQNFVLSPDFTTHMCKNLSVEDVEMCKRDGPVLGYSYTEAYTMLFPLGLYLIIAALIVMYAWPASEGYDLIIRLVMLIFDTWIILIWTSWAYFGALMQILFLQKVCDDLRIQRKVAK